MTEPRNLLKFFLIHFVLMVIISPTLFGQDSINIEGNYIDSLDHACFTHIKIRDNKLIVTRECYEFYGQPDNIYTFTYELKNITANTVSLRMIKSKMTSGTRRYRGSLKVSVKDRRLYPDGTYTIDKMSNGTIYLLNIEVNKIIVLIEKKVHNKE